MAKKFTKKDLSFDFGHNVRPRAKKAKAKAKRSNPKRSWKGITFGS